ncbi:hypothetical protein WR25_07807 [Diploscapter pachys]|uniref:Uncharacterized protein n=1 Tax=Diploscapter pachys TaxID=2018661 RepID=A0A2A2JQ66_9BILA|nr:hypothetical protein WR25_07807 [Diploscapter pachys]
MTDERSGPFFPNLYIAGDKAGEKPFAVPDVHLPGQLAQFTGRSAFNPFTHAVAAVYNEDLVDSWGTGFAVNGVNNYLLSVRKNFDQFADAPLERNDGMYQPFLTAGAVGAEYDLSKIREVSGHLDLPLPGLNELFDFDGRIMLKGYKVSSQITQVPNVNLFLVPKNKMMERLQNNRLNPTMIG